MTNPFNLNETSKKNHLQMLRDSCEVKMGTPDTTATFQGHFQKKQNLSAPLFENCHRVKCIAKMTLTLTRVTTVQDGDLWRALDWTPG